jgi:hypothetical protein
MLFNILALEFVDYQLIIVDIEAVLSGITVVQHIHEDFFKQIFTIINKNL